VFSHSLDPHSDASEEGFEPVDQEHGVVSQCGTKPPFASMGRSEAHVAAWEQLYPLTNGCTASRMTLEDRLRHMQVLQRDARAVEYRDLAFMLAARRLAGQDRSDGS
jgi:hypothetical protein